MKKKRTWISLLNFIILCLALELIGSYWTNQSVSTWYRQLIKPMWTPPGWVFGPIWTILYIMIAIAGWLIYKAKHSHHRSLALMLYGSQLALNFIWSFLFFSLKSPILGLIDILLLSLLIILTIIKGWRVRSLAGILLIPYLIWVIYAASLNAGIWILND